MFIKDNEALKTTHNTLENKSILYTFPVFLITRYKFRYYINVTDVNYMLLTHLFYILLKTGMWDQSTVKLTTIM
jgi:hypothetical protein